MAYGKIKADTLVYDNSGSDVETSISSLAAKASSPASPGTVGASEVVQVDANKDTTGIRNLTISGNLQVNGTTTTVASSTMTVTDKNIEIAKGAANDAAADGAGITIDSGDGDKTWNWVDATDAWTSSEHIHVGDNKRLIVGTGQDLRILHDSTNSYLHNYGGDLILQNDTTNASNLFLKAKSGQNSLVAIPDGATKAYHSGSIKIETTAAGVTVTGTVTDSKGDVRKIPRNHKTSAYVLIASDSGKCITISTGGVTVNNSVFAEGDAVTIVNQSGSDQTITQGSGFTIFNTADASTGNRTLAGRGMATLWFTAADTAYISGAGLS